MPLYKKSSLKTKVKTQNSFISPLLSKNKVNNLIGDDYTKNIPIPTKNKLLEPLINIAKEGQLLDQLEKKSFKDTNKTVIEVTKTKESWADANQPKKFKNYLTHNSNELSHDFSKINGVNKTSSFSKPTKLKKLNKTLSDIIRAQSPPLFDSPSSSVSSNKRLKREQSMVIRTEIKITSNTDGDMFKTQKECETPNSNISKILDDCVMNNIRMSQQIWNQNKSAEMSSKTLSKTDESINDKQRDDDQSELDSSLKSILDDIVQTNECLSQDLFDKDDDFEIKDTYEEDLNMKKNKSKKKNDLVEKEKKSKENREHKKHKLDDSLKSILDNVVETNERLSQNLFGKDNCVEMKETNKQYQKDIGTDLNTKKNKSKKRNGLVKRTKETKENREPKKRELDNSLKSNLDDIVQSNERLSQNLFGKDDDFEMKDTNKKYKKDVKRDLNTNKTKSKDNNNLVKRAKESKENREPKKIKKVLTPDRSEQIFETTTSKDCPSVKKTGEQLKQKNKSKYLIEKSKTKKNKNEGNQSDDILKKKKVEKNKKKLTSNDLVENTEKNGRKLNKKKSFIIAKKSSGFIDDDSQNKGKDGKLKNEKENVPPKPRNMIFTSNDSKTIDDKINELFELQDKRNVGLYVYCDSCDKVRHLPDCKDPLDLPAKWYCYMNSDQNYNKCSDPDYEINDDEENLLIYNKFNAGSIVWAKMDGYPWWPAMVDDDPDLTDYFWLDDLNQQEPSWYHVTFFDSCEVTRAWIRTASLEPFEENSSNKQFKPNKNDRYKHRVDFAIKEARTACKKSLLERLRLYSFASRYLKKKQQRTPKDKAKTGEKKEKSRKNYNMKMFCKDLLGNSNSYGAAKQQQHKNKSLEGCDYANEIFDDLSISSSQISTILKPGGVGGVNRICSDDDVLENIDFDHFI